MKTMRFFSMIFLAGLIGMSNLIASCHSMPGGIRGDGNVLKETRKVGSFTGIDVSGAFKIVIKQGTTEEVVVEADANLLPIIRTDVVGSTLRIDTKKSVSNPTTMKVYVTVKDLSDIDVSGAVDIVSDGLLTLNELKIDASGASDSDLELSVKRLGLDCSGASKMKFRGTAGVVEMDLSGASDIFAYDFVAETYNMEISGAGNAQIHATKKLSASVSGAGTVKYKGSPTEINQDVSGAGSIRKVN